MASEDIGTVYKTQIPGYEDAADIQAALKLYHYGTTTVPSTESALIANSVAGHLKSLDTRIDAVESIGTGGDVLATRPTSAPDGFIWVDSLSSGGGGPIYSQAVYSNSAPTENLSEGIIWVDKDANPPRAYIYDLTAESWVAITEIPGIVDAAGDIIYGSGVDNIERLPIGTTGQVLTVSSGLPSWQNQSGTWSESYSQALSGSSVSVTGLNASKYYIILDGWSHSDTSQNKSVAIRFNSDSGSNYLNPSGHTATTFLSTESVNNTGTYTYGILVDMANSSVPLKPVSSVSHSSLETEYGYYKSSSPITSIQLTLSSGSFDAGTLKVWSCS
jgi:hypothetical protein